MDPKLLKVADVIEQTKLGMSKVYYDVDNGLLPPPLKRDRSSFWVAHEIDAVVVARIGGKSDDEIKILVADLVAARGALFPQFLKERGIDLVLANQRRIGSETAAA
jgi:prophage regulatory protein